MYFPSKCVRPITIYLSKCINHVIIVLVQYHNRLWVLYLNCTHGYLQFDMLVAIVSVRNNETSFLGRVLQTIRVQAQKKSFSHLLPGYQTPTLIIMFTKYSPLLKI